MRLSVKVGIRCGVLEDPADRVGLWPSENSPLMKLICDALLWRLLLSSIRLFMLGSRLFRL